MGKRVQTIALKNLANKTLNLGYVGENDHTQIVFDCSEVLWDYPNAEASMVVQPPRGDLYPVEVERDGDDIIWEITASDVVYAGAGRIQLQFTNDGEIVKSAVGATRIEGSIETTGEAPTPLQNWMDQAEETARQIADDSAQEAAEDVLGSMAPAYSAESTYAVGDYAFHDGNLYRCTTAITTAEEWNASHWEETTLTESVSADVTDLKTATESLVSRVDAIEEAEGLHKYGVSGVGQSASALTRIWDSVGMTAQVGTDGDNSNVVNNFDDVTPFNRRKCVGKWGLVNGQPVFHVHAYLGDDDYAEDGTMGDYVAVECPRAYYYFKNGTLGVSAHQWPGWRPFDIFCRNHNPEDTVPYVYLPAYALALKNGKAVSLPGLDNFQGCYKDVMDACRTYDGDGVQAMAYCQPMAVNFYEWALFTVEFAQQNCQSVMQGCAGLRHNNDDRATLRSDGKWLLSNYYASRVVGEYISIQPTNIDVNAVAYYASHKITSITRCDAEGNASASGAYQLMETEDLGLEREYTEGESYRIAVRPYRTGECGDVSTPSGSPASNSDGYHPMKYRWRENVYSNQFKTVSDLFNVRIGTGDDDWKLEWYFLPDPEGYTPSSTSKPDATELANAPFVKLDIETAHANYVSGYIKTKQFSEDYPDIWIPGETTGGSASTYYADYAYLVYFSVVRAVRLGGAWHSGATDGFSFLSGSYAPSTAAANAGGDLFFPQAGVNAA